jgi:hypothetical protein
MNGVVRVNQLRFDIVIDRKLLFNEAGQAFEYLWLGIHVGKIVIELSEDGWIHKSGWSYVFVFSVKEVAFRLDIQILTTRLSRS